MKKSHLLDEIFAIIIFACVVIILASLFSYHEKDLSLLSSHPNIPPKNLIRGVGAYLAFGLFFIMGWASYLVPLVLSALGFNKMKHGPRILSPAKAVAFCVLALSLSSLLSLIFLDTAKLSLKAGGIIGIRFSGFVVDYFGKFGGYVIVVTLMLLSLLLLGEFLLYPILIKFSARLRHKFLPWRNSFPTVIRQVMTFFRQAKNIHINRSSRQVKVRQSARFIKQIPAKKTEEVKFQQRQMVAQGPESRLSILNPKNEIAKAKEKISTITTLQGDYQLPSLDLLDDPPQGVARRDIKEDLTANARILEDTLSDFGISARVTDIERGPTITRYELEPAPGVKVQRIVGLSDDIALSMKAQSVRIVAPIPGKGRVGIEVPNIQIGSVYFKELLQSEEFIKAKSKLTLALGKDITGKPVVADLNDMPHLLIAGATGSGKTVCVNCLVMSLLFRLTPNELKLLMVDPKMVELAGFNGLPHLLCPVVTEPKKVSSALNWVVNEMEQRYKLLAKEGVRNIDAYNDLGKDKTPPSGPSFEGIRKAYPSGSKVPGGSIPVDKTLPSKEQVRSIPVDKMPYIVVIIDELADLMAIAQNQIENAITRLAQLSRAVGIHLMLATQRPSVDVITGVIKANFPARVSFKVASKVDSRTVLDANGADKLLGKGDMLFLRPGQSKLMRIQGGYLQDKEIDQVVKFIKSQAAPVYTEEITKVQEKALSYLGGEKDELFDEAVRVILESNQASVSILQRRMRLGYTRAARIIDAMEEEGIVGPYQGSKPRKILVDRDAYLKKYRVESS